MSLLPAHRPHSLFPDLTEWLTGFPAVENLRPLVGGHLIKVEDELTEGKYLVRAELPGLDPDKDVEVVVRDGVLTIKAERSERHETKGRTEFSYGSFARSVSLPAGANEDGTTATYDKGILTVSVPVTTTQAPQGKRVSITSGE
ncbi:Hsp20/alpha crystallin family protein [Nocardia lijiangensis]|uniref:Hsp20/alpha crystallin family protein n=1 Tax=Nocardia lijiangensis TaxID=299618 RepID=UPI000833AF8D|nr:Hsp20/alpha crystallin family protein [Nocardia lijiangensis]